GGWFSLHQNDHLSGGGWEVPGSPSLQVANAVQNDWANAIPPAFTVFITGRAARRRADAVQRIVAAQENVHPDRPFSRGNAVFLPLAYLGKSSNAIDEATHLRRALVQTTKGAETRVIGEPAIWSNFQEVSKEQLARGEALGFPLILLILLAGFGTLVAAAAPLALGFAA